MFGRIRIRVITRFSSQGMLGREGINGEGVDVLCCLCGKCVRLITRWNCRCRVHVVGVICFMLLLLTYMYDWLIDM